MIYSNTLHGYWFLGITITLLAINHFIIPVAGTHANLICLFLILTIGISHGSLDNLKGNKILKLYSKIILFISFISNLFSFRLIPISEIETKAIYIINYILILSELPTPQHHSK